MIVIVGLVVVIVGFTGVLTNAHPLPENFAVFGYYVTGSTGTSPCSCSGSSLTSGDAGSERVAGRGAAHRGPWARRPTRIQEVPTRNGVSEPGADGRRTSPYDQQKERT